MNTYLLKGFSKLMHQHRALSSVTINLIITRCGQSVNHLLYSDGIPTSRCIKNPPITRNYSTSFLSKLTGSTLWRSQNHQQEPQSTRLLPAKTCLISQKFEKSKTSRRALLIDNVDVDQDTKLYHLTSYSVYFRRTILSGFGALICFYGCLFMWTLDVFPLVTEINPIPFIIKNRVILSISMGLFGIAAYATNKFFIWRTIAFIQLKAGGQRVEIRTLNRIPFSVSQKKFEVPLKNISCLQSRDMEVPYVRIKIKDKIGTYYIDKEGFFPDPILFDSTIGVLRKFR